MREENQTSYCETDTEPPSSKRVSIILQEGLCSFRAPDDNVKTAKRASPPKQLKSPLGQALLASLDKAFNTGDVHSSQKVPEKVQIPSLEHLRDIEQQIQRISYEKGWNLDKPNSIEQ